jgi:hypothetical protein
MIDSTQVIKECHDIVHKLLRNAMTDSTQVIKECHDIVHKLLRNAMTDSTCYCTIKIQPSKVGLVQSRPHHHLIEN